MYRRVAADILTLLSLDAVGFPRAPRLHAGRTSAPARPDGGPRQHSGGFRVTQRAAATSRDRVRAGVRVSRRHRARRARIAQDSSLKSYDAKVRQRLSVLMGVGKLGRGRLVYRNESAFRAQWQRGVGAHVEMTGARVAAPVLGSSKIERDAVAATRVRSQTSTAQRCKPGRDRWLRSHTAPY